VKNTRYIIVVYLLVGAMSISAMNNNNNQSNSNNQLTGQKRPSADTGDDNDSDSTDTEVHNIAVYIDNRVERSLCYALESDLKRIDPQASHVLFRYIQGKKITYAEKSGKQYTPLCNPFMVHIRLREALDLTNKNNASYELRSIAQMMLLSPQIKEWSLSYNSYNTITRDLTPEEKAVVEKIVHQSNYTYSLVQKTMEIALSDAKKENSQFAQEIQKYAKEGGYGIDNTWIADISTQAEYGLAKWFDSHNYEYHQRATAFLKKECKDENKEPFDTIDDDLIK